MNRTAIIAVVVVAALVFSAVGYEALVAGHGTTSVTGSGSRTASSSETNSSHVQTSNRSCGLASGQPAGDWTTYHGNDMRTGDATGAAGHVISCVQPGWVSSALEGEVYAEPLVYHGIVVVATERDMVYGLNLSSGAILWSASLGTPVNGSTLPCGDINPTGITGTPVIDPLTGTVYVVAFKAPGSHYLVALDVNTGVVKFTVLADPPGADPHVQQERGAMSLGNGKVYVVYGGLAGDCGDYHGWVVGLNADGTGGMVSYQVPSQREAGIWAPSGASMDASGNLYVATGNSASNDVYDFGNAVIKLSPSLQEVAYFAPSNWLQLNQGDTDLGSVGPMFLDNGQIFQIGKEGVGYLLNGTNLGGIGGQIFSGHVCSSAFGGAAIAEGVIFVGCTDGLVALSMSSNSFSVLWQGPSYSAGPPIVTGSVVWTIDTSNGSLNGYDTHTGSLVFSHQTASVTRFTTPAAATGWVLVGAGNEVYSFQLGE